MKYERTSSSPRMAVEESHEDVKRRGRRVVATTALQPGDAIYAAPPDIAVLYSPFARHICARCLVADVELEAKESKAPRQRGRTRSTPQPSCTQGSKSRPSNTAIPTTSTARTATSPVVSTTVESTTGATQAPTTTIAGTTTAVTLAMSEAAAATPPPMLYEAYVCPNCDQFVLCASCVGQLIFEVEQLAAAEFADEVEDHLIRTTRLAIHTASAAAAARMTGDAQAVLLRHPLLCAHSISCAWYVSLPESIRAPGNDTDFLRFCLDYGARVQLGDTAMTAALAKLDTNAAVQSKESHHLCEVFARDRVVATFGPRTSTTTSATLTSDPVSGLGASEAPVFPPPYPVSWTELRDVLLRTRCNSLGFPFSSTETMGWSLQETVCMLNHSCVPNAAVVMLYDAEDEQRLRRMSAEGTTPNAVTAAADEAEERVSQRQHSGRRRAQHLSLSPHRDSGQSRNNNSSSSGNKKKNLNSYRAIAVSSPSLFTTPFTEALQGWIGIQATRPIAAGEEITVSYIDLELYGDDVQARSRHLLEQYRFLCTCELCTRQRGRKV